MSERHPVLSSIGSLRYATDDQLENAVDILMMEAENSSFCQDASERAARAEALAILSHEFRRRTK